MKQIKRLGAALACGSLLGAIGFGSRDPLFGIVAVLALAANFVFSFRFEWWTWYLGAFYSSGIVIGLTLAAWEDNLSMPEELHSVVIDLDYLLVLVAFMMIPWALGRFLQYCNRPHSSCNDFE